MTNIINSHNVNINNVMNANQLYFGKNTDNEVYAPVSLPKFSIDKLLQEKDEFRQQVKDDLHYQMKKESRKPSKTKIIIAALAGLILLLFGRKTK